MSRLHARGLPEEAIRERARKGAAAIFPPEDEYGRAVLGADVISRITDDPLDRARLVPPVFMPRRLEKLIDLAREPLFGDVDLETRIGGFDSTLPVYVSAFGSTRVGTELALSVGRQAGRLGIPMVVGENVAPVHGARADSSLVNRLESYVEGLPAGRGGVVVQQSTEDADAEVWNQLYSSPSATPLLESGRLGFELKVGQGAKPGLGGMTLIGDADADRLTDRYAVGDPWGPESGLRLRGSSPGTFTEEILHQQIRFTRNNFPRASIWVKLPPGRDVGHASRVAWAAGADAVTVDGAEGGSGWAPTVFLDRVGLPLGECLRRIGEPEGCLLASGRIWEAGRAVVALALGARAVGLGRAALIAVDEDPENGLINLVDALAMEARLLISALGVYSPDALSPEDVLLHSPSSLARTSKEETRAL
ncbi:glutamate synthase-related protein [Nocardiopsis alba]|uniref:Glutamate synthase-related protein n=2 Tax=Nocardiopsis alba TaxID=53437 RepID=A0ABV5E1B0_9ACTN|nr:glutamate synthase-related protein [Nocardiopsis alba]AFR07914.1 FMN-dependent dehydrogenase family protein [Nocardiopsis alba ATCC BAA-2165]